jgi:hypothetical protein
MHSSQEIDNFFGVLKNEASESEIKRRILRSIDEIEKLNQLKNEKKHEAETAKWCLSSTDLGDSEIDQELYRHWTKKAHTYECLQNVSIFDETGVLLRMPGLKLEEEERAKRLIPMLLKERKQKLIRTESSQDSAQPLDPSAPLKTPIASSIPIQQPLATFPRGYQKADHKPFELLVPMFFKKTQSSSKWQIVSQVRFKQLHCLKFWLPVGVVIMLNCGGTFIWMEHKYSAKFIEFTQTFVQPNSWNNDYYCSQITEFLRTQNTPP